MMPAMGKITLSLSDALVSFVDAQASARGFETSGDYVCALIQKDLDRQHLRGSLLHGAQSAPAAQADGAYFASLRARIRSLDAA